MGVVDVKNAVRPNSVLIMMGRVNNQLQSRWHCTPAFAGLTGRAGMTGHLTGVRLN